MRIIKRIVIAFVFYLFTKAKLYYLKNMGNQTRKRGCFHRLNGQFHRHRDYQYKIIPAIPAKMIIKIGCTLNFHVRMKAAPKIKKLL